MKAIQLAILAILANGLRGIHTTLGSNVTETDPTASPSLHNSSKLIPTTSWIRSTPTTTSDFPNNTSQFTSTFSTETQSIPNSTSHPTSYVESINQTTKFATKFTTIKFVTKFTTTIFATKFTTSQSSTIKPTTNYQDGNLPASMIVACFIGGVLLLMVVIIIAILVWKRCSKPNFVRDDTWAGTCTVPNIEDSVPMAEGNERDAAPAKRPSLTTFLSKKSKRESLLEQYDMEVQESEGITNASSPDIEEKFIVPAELKTENETGKETQALSGTQSQDFPPPPLEAQAPLNDNDPHAPLPATDRDDPGPHQEDVDVDPNTTNLTPPPLDFLDLVNDVDLTPPLAELQV
uniref:uncharacterized protein n=1 Tax=Pristiophorus japonicus TaxID=55135 RepID=UPI00398EAE06